MAATQPENAITSGSTSSQNIALALGGLAGSNAWGAGCLQAALEELLHPKQISCTSGQIFWVYSYLRAHEPGKQDIRARFEEYHQQEAPVFNMMHSLCRAIWHGPHTWLFWGLCGGERVEHEAKLREKKLLALAWMPVNDMVFNKFSPWSAGFLPFMFMHERDWIIGVKNLMGVPDRYRMPLPHVIFDTACNLFIATGNLLTSPDKRTYLVSELTDFVPARLAEPVFLKDDALINKIAKAFNNCRDIGILFNCHDPRDGFEHVFLNKKAREEMPSIELGPKTSDPSKPQYQDRVIYEEITPEAVRHALWLWYYGFQPSQENVYVDGAYFREVILSELQGVEKIYVARPVNHQWKGPFPQTFTEIRDMETEVLFNGSYQGERDKILLVNKFLAENKLQGGQPNEYRPTELIEVEIETQRGFYDYLFEDEEVFEDAVEQFKAVF